MLRSVLLTFPLALALRGGSRQQLKADSKLCVGCNDYPEAADFDDDWRTEVGVERTVRTIQEIRDSANASDPQEVIKTLQLQWEIAMHGIFNLLQGQDCRDLCAICGPSEQELREVGNFKLRSVSVTRARNWQATAVMPITVPVDTILGGVAGATLAIPAALLSFVGGGVVAGAATGVATAHVAKNFTGSFAGNILGTLAGITTGTMSGAALAAVVEILGLSVGLWKGISPAKFACKRVGFERWSNGQALKTTEVDDFASKAFNPDYGLKRLRKWMNETAPAEVKTGQLATTEQVQASKQWAKDNESVSHCERLRENKFDMRHASQCLKHSKMCGDAPRLMVPVSSPEQCRKMSDMSYLESIAIAFGDDPEEGLFAQWRKFQEQLKGKWGYDGKREQCITLLCEYGGFYRASLQLHPDKVGTMDLPLEEKAALINIYTFLSQCKMEYKDADGGDLMLNKASERAEVCPSHD